ncbi:YbbR-like domain-containing protein [Liquorilactobacillus oeni]|uniref:YbbR family protein n=1 Tax=Liquorilactobacillus oeni DSM 19972 TaxID=1423777 RepID=A0A0R1MF57_9LACO|nr:CdaR family protein [Liquorilactobacillus oeni]KRL03925.1 YbbR family protein [Liquorilactobacillus oeni DSM 19972]
MNFNKIIESRLFYRIVALILAIFLFVYTNSDKLSTTRNSSNNNEAGMLSNRTESMNVSLQLDVNSDKYFVTGYPSRVNVKITGPSALVTTTANTRNFRIYADLNKLKTGTHEVKLKQSGLNKELDYTINPKTIKVTISPRKTATFPVQFRYDKEKIAGDYGVGRLTADPQAVSVTGAKDDINNISEVLAVVDLTKGTKETVSRSVLLQAVNNRGKILNVVITPQAARVRIPIYNSTSSKKVAVDFSASGNGVSGKSYRFSSSTKEVTVNGTKGALSRISKMTVPVPISGLADSETQTIELQSPGNGISSIQPKSIKVKIDVTDDQTANKTTSEGDSTRETEKVSSSSSEESSSSSSKDSSESVSTVSSASTSVSSSQSD